MKIDIKKDYLENVFELLKSEGLLTDDEKEDFRIDSLPEKLMRYSNEETISHNAFKTKIVVSFLKEGHRAFKELTYFRRAPAGDFHYKKTVHTKLSLTDIKKALSKFLHIDEVVIDSELILTATNAKRFYLKAKKDSYLYYGVSVVEVEELDDTFRITVKPLIGGYSSVSYETKIRK